jgi:hypothetical protein
MDGTFDPGGALRCFGWLIDSGVFPLLQSQKTLTALREIYTSPDIDALAVVDEVYAGPAMCGSSLEMTLFAWVVRRPA